MATITNVLETHYKTISFSQNSNPSFNANHAALQIFENLKKFSIFQENLQNCDGEKHEFCEREHQLGVHGS